MCIESRADNNAADFDKVLIESDGVVNHDTKVRDRVKVSKDNFCLASGLNADSYYLVSLDISALMTFEDGVFLRASCIQLDEYTIFFNGIGFSSSNGYIPSHSLNTVVNVVLPGSVLSSSTLLFSTEVLTTLTYPVNTYELELSLGINTLKELSESDLNEYQNGYNDGYSDGLLDGEASVDTEAIRNEAYQAGYEAGFADGSDDTLKEDKEFIETVTGSFTLPGQVLNSYSQQYITGPSLSIATGSLTHTMNSTLGYSFEVGKDYLVDFKKFTVSNSNVTYQVDLGEYVSHYISNYGTFTLSGPGLSMSSLGELIYSPTQTGDFQIRVSVPAELVLRSTYNEAIENDYVDIPSSGYASGKLNWDTTFEYEIDVYEIDIVEEIDYLRDQSNKLGDLNNTQQEALDVSKETQATTKGIFESTKEFFGSFFQNLVDSVLGLFVPSTEEMSGLFDQLNQFFSDRFGFLYAPFDYMIQLLDVFVTSTGDTRITFPGFSIMGYEVWPDMTYDISEDPLVGQIFEYVRMGTGILLAGWFIMYLQDFFKERFSQG